MRPRLSHLYVTHFRAEADSQKYSVPEAQSGRSPSAMKGADITVRVMIQYTYDYLF